MDPREFSFSFLISSSSSLILHSNTNSNSCNFWSLNHRLLCFQKQFQSYPSSLHHSLLMASSQHSNHKKRRKLTHHASLAPAPWTSQTEHRIYASNLLHALRRNSPAATRDVRAAADRALAATAKGRTRWSRAILANPFGRWKRRNHKKARKSGAGLVKKKTPEILRTVPPLQKKARVLGRLIPGCRNLSFPKLLEEAGDYISALEMQVRAMTALADLLAGGPAPPAPLRSSWPTLFFSVSIFVYYIYVYISFFIGFQLWIPLLYPHFFFYYFSWGSYYRE